MTLPETQTTPGMFSGAEVSELCDAIKDIHRLLISVGGFYSELDGAEDPGGNGLQIDFKKWGIRTITEDLLSRQYRMIDRIVEIYKAEQERMKTSGRVRHRV
ncbi:hypothetical protein [Desulfoluna spongiiphila]|uniref:Uncharacterized protein n=1 Tax=Desulfoluna spongiiphila TaxID=419481 RepID=A0A1G5DWM9_9BACT|nr:hypothetical protein [Desulfoluna spongiiphila]SCY18891.1 hypothetical protein SAMN05216233_10528 [Desulfoluna spongiiphila]VVS91451.1 hypothetical protein DBB_10190 [Desulfoluna spongiiphila]